jgi:hypothetical protein
MTSLIPSHSGTNSPFLAALLCEFFLQRRLSLQVQTLSPLHGTSLLKKTILSLDTILRAKRSRMVATNSLLLHGTSNMSSSRIWSIRILVLNKNSALIASFLKLSPLLGT